MDFDRTGRRRKIVGLAALAGLFFEGAVLLGQAAPPPAPQPGQAPPSQQQAAPRPKQKRARRGRRDGSGSASEKADDQ